MGLPQSKASILSVSDMELEGMSDWKSVKSMKQISGKRYAVISFNGRDHTNSVDIISSGTVKAIVCFTDAFSVTVNKDLMLIAHSLDSISVLRGTQKVGAMNVQVRLLKCKSGVYYFDRWIQQSKSNLFILDNSLNLLNFKWTDIHAGTYTKKR